MIFSKLFTLALCVLVMTWGPVGTASAHKSWPVFGGNIKNTHNAKYTGKIRPHTVEKRGFRLKWKQSNNGVISSQALASYEKTSHGKFIYQTVGLELRALDANTGNIVWSKSIPDMGAMLGVNWEGARSTPAIYKDYLILAHRNDSVNQVPFAWLGNQGTGLWIFAVDKHTGDFDPDNGIGWATKVEAHPSTLGTASPVVDRGNVYIGYGGDDYTNVATWPFFTAFFFGMNLPVADRYVCCNMRGAMVALDADTGFVKWKTYTTPPRPAQDGFPDEKNYVGLDAFGPNSPLLRRVDATSVSGPDTWYSGATSWGSSPAVDRKRGLLYISTGNNGTVAPESRLCEMKRQGIIPANDPTLTAKLAAISADFGSPVTCDGENNTTKLNDAFHPVTVHVNKNPDGNFYPEHSYGNMANSIIALDLETGEKVWHHRVQEYDAYTVACDFIQVLYHPFVYGPLTPPLVLPGNPSVDPTLQQQFDEMCPFPTTDIAGNATTDDRDADFAQSPMLVKVKSHKNLIGILISLFNRDKDDFDKEDDFYEEGVNEEDDEYEEDGYHFFKKIFLKELVITASKGGKVVALKPSTGEEVWTRKLSAGGLLGGFEWAAAADNKHIYVVDSMIDNTNSFFGFAGSMNDLSEIYFGDPQNLSYHEVCESVENPNRIDPFTLAFDPNPPAFASGRLTVQQEAANDPLDNGCQIPKNYDGTPGITKAYAQILSAIRLTDGALVWQYADPSGEVVPNADENTLFRSHKNHGVTLANGVLFDSTHYGVIRMHNAKTGKILRELDLRGTGYEQAVSAAPTIVGNQVFYITGNPYGLDNPFPFDSTPGACDGVDCSANFNIIALELCPRFTKVSDTDPTQCESIW